MCGRFTHMMPWGVLIRLLRGLPVPDPQTWDTRYNVRPGEPGGAVVLRLRDGGVFPDRLKWGFQPDATRPFAPINAKSETLFRKWPWGFAARNHRCAIPMDGFFEPKGHSKQRNRPQIYFRFPDRRPFLVAGVWTQTEGLPLDTFAIITTEPNPQVEPIHDRMPAIVNPEHFELWLSDSKDIRALRGALRPWGGDPLESWEVDRELLKTADDERCIEPI